MNMLSKATEWVARQRKANASIEVEYRRGVSHYVVMATVGKTIFRLDSEYGVSERIESRDYLIDVADLPLEPQAGDRIRENEGNGTYRLYEVMAPGNEPAWRYSGPFRDVYRVHTKFVGTE